jgi:hypothetical protein
MVVPAENEVQLLIRGSVVLSMNTEGIRVSHCANPSLSLAHIFNRSCQSPVPTDTTR